MSLTRRATVAMAAAAALALTAASLLAVAFLGPPPGAGTAGTPACAPPELAGTAVRVTAVDMGSRMMGSAPMVRAGMRLSVDRAAVPHGQVSLAVVNLGGLPHELLVLPLPAGQAPGSRPTGPDGRIDESGLLAEASATCGAGEGPGIAPGAASWVTLDLPAGDYELLCNYPGHYAAGMHVRLTVT